MNCDEEEYLGDGLYATLRGGEVRLRAPRREGDHEVFLDQRMTQQLVDWLRKRGMSLR